MNNPGELKQVPRAWLAACHPVLVSRHEWNLLLGTGTDIRAAFTPYGVKAPASKKEVHALPDYGACEVEASLSDDPNSGVLCVPRDDLGAGAPGWEALPIAVEQERTYLLVASGTMQAGAMQASAPAGAAQANHCRLFFCTEEGVNRFWLQLALTRREYEAWKTATNLALLAKMRAGVGALGIDVVEAKARCVEMVQTDFVKKGAGAPGETWRSYHPLYVYPFEDQWMLARFFDVKLNGTEAGAWSPLRYCVPGGGRGIELLCRSFPRPLRLVLYADSGTAAAPDLALFENAARLEIEKKKRKALEDRRLMLVNKAVSVKFEFEFGGPVKMNFTRTLKDINEHNFEEFLEKYYNRQKNESGENDKAYLEEKESDIKLRIKGVLDSVFEAFNQQKIDNRRPQQRMFDLKQARAKLNEEFSELVTELDQVKKISLDMSRLMDDSFGERLNAMTISSVKDTDISGVRSGKARYDEALQRYEAKRAAPPSRSLGDLCPRGMLGHFEPRELALVCV